MQFRIITNTYGGGVRAESETGARVRTQPQQLPRLMDAHGLVALLQARHPSLIVAFPNIYSPAAFDAKLSQHVLAHPSPRIQLAVLADELHVSPTHVEASLRRVGIHVTGGEALTPAFLATLRSEAIAQAQALGRCNLTLLAAEHRIALADVAIAALGSVPAGFELVGNELWHDNRPFHAAMQRLEDVLAAASEPIALSALANDDVSASALDEALKKSAHGRVVAGLFVPLVHAKRQEQMLLDAFNAQGFVALAKAKALPATALEGALELSSVVVNRDVVVAPIEAALDDCGFALVDVPALPAADSAALLARFAKTHVVAAPYVFARDADPAQFDNADAVRAWTAAHAPAAGKRASACAQQSGEARFQSEWPRLQLYAAGLAKARKLFKTPPAVLFLLDAVEASAVAVVGAAVADAMADHLCAISHADDDGALEGDDRAAVDALRSVQGDGKLANLVTAVQKAAPAQFGLTALALDKKTEKAAAAHLRLAWAQLAVDGDADEAARALASLALLPKCALPPCAETWQVFCALANGEAQARASAHAASRAPRATDAVDWVQKLSL